MNPNGVKVTGERLTQNSRPGFFLGYGEALTCALARVDILPLYDIYEPKSQKSRRIFKFLQFRTKRTAFRGNSRRFDIFRHFSSMGANYPSTIYTKQNHKYHAENLIFYSIEQKGLFTDNGRRTPPPQSAPMGSRLASLLLSVRACGSGQRTAASLGAYSPIFQLVKNFN